MKWSLFLGGLMSLTLAVYAEDNDDPHLWLEEVTGDKEALEPIRITSVVPLWIILGMIRA